MEQQLSEEQAQKTQEAIRRLHVQDRLEATPPRVPPLEIPETEPHLVSPLPLNNADLPKTDLRFAFWFFLSPLAVVSFLAALGSGEWPLSLIIAGLSLFLVRFTRAANALERDEALLKLAHFDPKLLGPFIEALEHPDLRLRTVAVRALRQMFPRLQPGDLDSLTRSQRACLCRRLREYPPLGDVELHLAMLEAMGRVGTEEVVPYIDQLAESAAWTPKQRRVRAAARACLAVLGQRLDAERKEQPTPEPVVQEETQEEVQTPETLKAAADVRNLMFELEEERRKHQQPGMRIGFLVASWGVIVPFTGFRFFDYLFASNAIGALLWGLLFLFATQLHRFTLSFKQTAAMRKLAGYDNIQGVGILAEALEWPDTSSREVAAQALPRLLRRLKASDANLLNARQRGCLYRMLSMRHASHHADLVKAILKALEQVGDKEAIPYVDRLVNSRPWSHKQREIQEAADVCLTYLRDRAALQDSSQMLLRASSAIGVTPHELLLRPAQSTPETAGEQLLRPGTIE